MGDSSDKGSPIICQLPGCKSTQRDVETALLEYYSSYCVKCEKKRNGNPCGCPFPCSLTFKGQMLEKIYQLIGADVPSGMKSIQVCFKHPELLRLAREAILAYKMTREEVEHQDRLDTDQHLNKEQTSRPLKTIKITDDCSVVNISSSLLPDSKLRVEIPDVFPMLPVSDHREFLQPIDNQEDILEARDVTEGMTGIVYTDEGGHEQSLLGKLVYTTDETGSSNIILEELGGVDTGEGKAGRIMKIQLGDMPGFVLPDMDTGGGDGLQEQEDNSIEQELHSNLGLRTLKRDINGLPVDSVEDDGRKSTSRDILEPATNSISLQHNVLRRKIGRSNAPPRTITISRRPTVPKSWSNDLQPLQDSVLDDMVEDKLLGPPKFSGNLKIQYKEFEQKLITSQFPSLLSYQQLCDVLLVCSDGEMFASSIVLASISDFMRELLDSVPRIDSYRTIILPDYFNISNLSLLNRMIFQDVQDDVSLEDLDNLLTIAQTLQCHRIAEFCESRILNLTTLMRMELEPSPSENENSQVESLEHSLVLLEDDGTTHRNILNQRISKKHKKNMAPSLTSLKIDKSALNSDFLDPNGIVRLDSRDEMALHYCILCDAKFKKYKQAINHYKGVHLLEALLSCDECDELFKDMFNCNKHKYEQHGGFERNLQCYICEEVFYSRFRLSSHFKEVHKDLYGEFVCKTCCMKFPAKHYHDRHLEEDHTTLSNRCKICTKTFSGKRYLTMHIKSSHQMGGKFDFQCKYCGLTFNSKKEHVYHCVKNHKEPKPPGLFEDCLHCEKFFKSKSELKQHMGRKHKDQ